LATALFPQPQAYCNLAFLRWWGSRCRNGKCWVRNLYPLRSAKS